MARSRSKAVAAHGDGSDLSGWARRPGDRQFVEALARGLEVLRAFKPNDGVLGNQDIAERTNLPRPTITRLTYTLTKLGYLTYLERLGRYKLAPGALSIGYAAMANFRVREVARPFMQAVADEAKASVALGGPDRLSMVYISHFRSNSRVGVRLEVGSRIPMATSAMGRAYLAALPEEERAQMLELIRQRSGADWPRVQDGIEQGLDQIAHWGFAMSVGEWQDDINGVGVPFVPQDGSGVFAFNCGAPAFMLDKARLQHKLGPRLVDMVRDIEALLAGGDAEFGVKRDKNPVLAGGGLGGESDDGERKGLRPKSAGRRERPGGR